MERSRTRGTRRVTATLVAMLLLTTFAATGATATTGTYDPFFAVPATVADFGGSSRPFGVAAGDFDGDGDADMIVGRTTGNVAFVAGNGDGTFAPPSVFAWKQAFFNAWAFAPGDVNGDGHLDVVWGAAAAIGSVADGDVRVWYGNGDGTFVVTADVISGVTYNAGTLLADMGTDTGSVATGDIDGDGDDDVVAGAVEGVKLIRNDGASFTVLPVDTSGTYFPTTSTQNSPWGLAFGDADGDGDADLWVGDRALYVYLYANDGAGAFTVIPGNIPGLETRPNVYLRHDSHRAAVGYTASLASADVNGDDKADLFLGLHSGTQTPTSNVANDGVVLLDVSHASGHTGFGAIGDLGTVTRGLQTADVNADGATDVLGAVYEGQVRLLRQLPPRDADGDGISDYVDNAPNHANAPRIEMNADGSLNAADQLDNDFDTVLGNPEDETTWQRLGDPADADDDNDGVADNADNCVFTPNADQANKDGDGFGDGCDPLNDSDPDGDGVPTFDPADPLYAAAQAAKAKWATHETKFVLRNDALGRFFQNEFTQLLTDATILTPDEWAAKCWENYDPGDVSATYEPCGDDETKTLTLPGGGDVPMSLVVIPKHLWTDPPVVAWINDRNSNPNLEIGQHGTFHDETQAQGDWKDLTDRNFFSCETCGLTEAESFERLKLGYDTLVGDYSNKYVRDMGAVEGTSPEIDWTDAAHPLISYAAPFNTADDTSRKAMAQYGMRVFTASIHEESGSTGYGEFFASPGMGNQHETLDHYGLFHASADTQLDPVETPDGSYDADDAAAFLAEMQAETEVGGLNTWLIEEVEWSGRTNNEMPRETDASAPGGINRETNTVYLPRWLQWMDLLDYVKANGVVMTLDEVGLAKAFDNAPTVANPGQEDTDHDGVGDVVEGVVLSVHETTLGRNVEGDLSATLTNGAGDSLAGQSMTFSFDADGDGTDEEYDGVTDADGTATVAVTATRAVGPADVAAAWSDGNGVTAQDTSTITVADATVLTLAATPVTGQVTDQVTVSATLVDSDSAPLAGREVAFDLGGVTGSGTTDASGVASATLTLVGPAGTQTLSADFAGAALYAGSSDSRSFTVAKEDTAVAATAVKNVITATLTEADGAGLGGRVLSFTVQKKVKGTWQTINIGTAQTNSSGVATFTVPLKHIPGKGGSAVTVTFPGDGSFLTSTTQVVVTRR